MHQTASSARSSRARVVPIAAAPAAVAPWASVLAAGLCALLPLAGTARGAALEPASQATPAAADPAARKSEPVVLRAGKLVVRPGQVLENVSVLVEDGVITQVGKLVTPPDGARVIEGAFVCAGFIDAWSVYGVDRESIAEQRNSPSAASRDALDPYIHPRLRKELLRAGITTVRTQIGVLSRVGGTGAALRLHPDRPLEETRLSDECCLSMALGVRPDGNPSDPFERLQDVERIAGMITQGESYALDRTEYEHELAEWKKKVAEKQKELEEGFKKAKKDREKEQAEAKEKGKEFKEKEFKEDKPPKPPKFDPDKEVLARVADGRIPLIVEAHRSSQLRALLAATAPFKRLRLILAGGTDALDVAPELARRRIPVLVWPQPQGAQTAPEMERHDLRLAARLEAAGVDVLLGSGARNAMASRELPLLAELAVGHGLPREEAFAALTTRAARALNLDQRIGSVELGKDADLLVLDGEPLSGATRIQYVLSAGDVVITPEDR